MTSRLEWALRHVEAGFKVFPLAAGTKIPLKGTNGLRSATGDRGTIVDWWTKQPTSNVGIATEASKLVVVDIDIPKANHPEVSGMAAWCQLVARAGLSDEPRTFEVWTPSGGEHLYWAAPPGVTIKTAASVLGPALDVRASGGSIVAPGSETPLGAYELRHDCAPQQLPDWLFLALLNAGLVRHDRASKMRSVNNCQRSRVKSSSYAAAVLNGEAQKVEQAGEGSRNQSLNWAAFRSAQFIGPDLAEETVEQVLISAALASGLTEPEAAATIRSGITAGKSRVAA